MPGMYIEGRRIKNFADIQKNYQFEVNFSKAHGLVNGWSEEDVTLRARSFSLPQQGFEAIESNFGAMKQFFPGKPTFSNTTEIIFEETHSQGVQRFLNAWKKKIFDVTAGHSNYERKRGNGGIGNAISDGICDLITITAFDNRNNPLDNKYFFYNAWLQNVNEVSLDYSQAGDAVKFNATFQFDFFDFGVSPSQIDPNNVLSTNVDVNSGIKE